jgi:hypothetical protein
MMLCVNGHACLGDKNITRLPLAATQAFNLTSSTWKRYNILQIIYYYIAYKCTDKSFE